VSKRKLKNRTDQTVVYIKGILHPKMKILKINLLILKLLQTCMRFFLLLNTQEDILKNDWNQTVVWHH